MDEEIKKFSVEDCLRYIKKYLQDTQTQSGFTLQFFQGKWRAAIDGIAHIEEVNLKDALAWLCMNIKYRKNVNWSYR